MVKKLIQHGDRRWNKTIEVVSGSTMGLNIVTRIARWIRMLLVVLEGQ